MSTVPPSPSPPVPAAPPPKLAVMAPPVGALSSLNSPKDSFDDPPRPDAFSVTAPRRFNCDPEPPAARTTIVPPSPAPPELLHDWQRIPIPLPPNPCALNEVAAATCAVPTETKALLPVVRTMIVPPWPSLAVVPVTPPLPSALAFSPPSIRRMLDASASTRIVPPRPAPPEPPSVSPEPTLYRLVAPRIWVLNPSRAFRLIVPPWPRPPLREL